MLPSHHMPRLVVTALTIGLVAACGDSGETTSDLDAGSGADGLVDGGASADAGRDAVSCDPTTAAEYMDCVDPAQYLDDLVFVAKPRPPGSPHWQEVQDLCAARFGDLGFDVEIHDYGTGVNVIGTMTGTTKPSELVVISAHYDHHVGCPGADDNGSGLVGVFQSASALSRGTFPRTLVVACWDEEEIDLIGARAWVTRLAAGNDEVIVCFNYDTFGYYSDEPDSQSVPAGFDALFPDQVASLTANDNRGDFVAIIVDESAVPWAEVLAGHAEDQGVPAYLLDIPDWMKSNDLIHDLRRSDHAPFWDADYPALQVTDTANFRNPHYHCADGPDLPEDLDHEKTVAVIKATTAAAAAALAAE